MLVLFPPRASHQLSPGSSPAACTTLSAQSRPRRVRSQATMASRRPKENQHTRQDIIHLKTQRQNQDCDHVISKPKNNLKATKIHTTKPQAAPNLATTPRASAFAIAAALLLALQYLKVLLSFSSCNHEALGRDPLSPRGAHDDRADDGKQAEQTAQTGNIARHTTVQ